MASSTNERMRNSLRAWELVIDSGRLIPPPMYRSTLCKLVRMASVNANEKGCFSESTSGMSFLFPCLFNLIAYHHASEVSPSGGSRCRKTSQCLYLSSSHLPFMTNASTFDTWFFSRKNCEKDGGRRGGLMISPIARISVFSTRSLPISTKLVDFW